MKEPVKYEKNPKGKWVITQAWKDWRDNKVERTHREVWKPVAYHESTTIYFCACLSTQGEPLRGCGAVGIKRSRQASIEILVGPIDSGR